MVAVPLLIEQGTAATATETGAGMAEVAPQGEDEIKSQEGVAYII